MVANPPNKLFKYVTTAKDAVSTGRQKAPPFNMALNVMNMKYTAILILFLSTNIFASELVKYQDPASVFEISVPLKWNKSHPTGQKNIATFTPEYGGVELTISTTYNLKLPTPFPEQLVAYIFPNEKPITTAIRKKGENWNSISQNWAGFKGPAKTVWLAEFIGYKTNAIIITLSTNEADISKYEDLFNKVISSIEYR